MENASKALLIAAGMFLALLILSMLIYMSNSINGIAKKKNEKKAAEQLTEFNAKYEAYNKMLMYGTDVVTIINKAKEDGITIALDGVVMIDSKATLEDVRTNIKNAKLDPNDDNYEGLKIYECILIKYDGVTGKVNYMEFKKRS